MNDVRPARRRTENSCGRAAYEGLAAQMTTGPFVAWDELALAQRQVWEDLAAGAAVTAAMTSLAAERDKALDALRNAEAQRDQAFRQLAIATCTLSDLRHAHESGPFARETAKSALDQIGAVEIPGHAEADVLREQLAGLRERLHNLARGLDLAGTEVERGCAAAVRDIAGPEDTSAACPAVSAGEVPPAELYRLLRLLNLTDTGQTAYGGYCASSNGVNLTSGDDLPAWESLPVFSLRGWQAAADWVVADIATTLIRLAQEEPGGWPDRVATLREELDGERALRLHATGVADDARSDLRLMRDLAVEIISEFSSAKGDGYRARVGQVKYTRWRERAGHDQNPGSELDQRFRGMVAVKLIDAMAKIAAVEAHCLRHADWVNLHCPDRGAAPEALVKANDVLRMLGVAPVRFPSADEVRAYLAAAGWVAPPPGQTVWYREHDAAVIGVSDSPPSVEAALKRLAAAENRPVNEVITTILGGADDVDHTAEAITGEHSSAQYRAATARITGDRTPDSPAAGSQPS